MVGGGGKCGGGIFPLNGGGPIPDIGGGIPIGGGGGGTAPPKPRGAKTSFSSSSFRSVKSRSHSLRGREIFRTNSSQCSSFSDFLGSTFLISWSVLGDLKKLQELLLGIDIRYQSTLTWICLLCFYF